MRHWFATAISIFIYRYNYIEIKRSCQLCMLLLIVLIMSLFYSLCTSSLYNAHLRSELSSGMPLCHRSDLIYAYGSEDPSVSACSDLCSNAAVHLKCVWRISTSFPESEIFRCVINANDIPSIRYAHRATNSHGHCAIRNVSVKSPKSFLIF